MLKKLINECKEFRKNEIATKKQEEIYDGYYKIYFYEELKSFFEYYQANKEIEEETYNKICKYTEEYSMKQLFLNYISYDEAISLATWLDIEDFLYKNKKDNEYNY